ncbi:hypothetical protein K4F52_005313 [Lecanicillium sp. MT-2017a]|nr:hypothetical protein K4F52_005313 [Lecanicillium sp. MT-2017a]
MQPQIFNVLTTTAADLQQLLANKEVTSVQIVGEYLSQIDRHEAALNALISIAPRDKLLRAAASLDAERQDGSLRSKLHGIPIILKDCFTTASDLGMSTTCGSLAFVGAKASRNSTIVQRMIDAGLIVLAKANMTAPGGSSTGSAVAVSAGFSPLAMGTETIGSIITPSNRNFLYGLKPTVGAQDTTGMYSMTEFYDSPGPMAKCAADVRDMTQILLGKDFKSPNIGSWAGISVGFVDPALWTLSEDMCTHHQGTAEQMAEDFNSVVAKLRDNGCPVKHPIHVPDVSSLPDAIHIAHWDFKHICIPNFVAAFDDCPVKTVEDIVNFNEAHKDKAMPAPYTEQNDLIKAMNKSEDPELIQQMKKELRNKAREILGKLFEENGVNLLVAPCDSGFCVYAAAAGYPLAAVPVGQLHYNGRPFGACIIAEANKEDLLLQYMEEYEAVWGARPVPSMF